MVRGALVLMLSLLPVSALAGSWTDLAAVPRTVERYPPQGLTLIDGELWFTNHWKDTKSQLYVLDPATGAVVDEWELPAEATHVSGLAWDGRWLWAVDHETTNLYRIDTAATRRDGAVKVLATLPTGLPGASACTVVWVDGRGYLAVSAFMHSARTWLVPLEDLSRLGPATVPDLARVSYPNGRFSQGLTWDGVYLYELVNNVLGDDRVEVLDVAAALRAGDSDLVRNVTAFAAPGPAGEDLATDGQSLWTTDERTYRLYVRRDVAALRGATVASRLTLEAADVDDIATILVDGVEVASCTWDGSNCSVSTGVDLAGRDRVVVEFRLQNLRYDGACLRGPCGKYTGRFTVRDDRGRVLWTDEVACRLKDGCSGGNDPGPKYGEKWTWTRPTTP